MLRPFFAVCILVFSLALSVHSQDVLEKPIPIDDKIRIGKLDNGLTYYIRKNDKPEKRVEMRLVVKAGSALEDEDQQGLAHFVEHMAFNGTKNFAKNDLVHYMQSVGVQFGPEVNAETRFGETVYMLTLPTDSVHILEKGFQIMEDWAHNITFDPAEIDKERGIIIEEWRLNQGFSERFRRKLFPVLFEGSKYGTRNPLGKKEIVENAPYATIKKFYTDWYRPDLMAFFVVGDVDPDAMEKTIKDHFSALKNPENERTRPSFPIPDKPGTVPMVFSDKEIPVVQLAMLCKVTPEKSEVQGDYRKSLMIQMVCGILTQRINELREQANPAVLGANVSYEALFPEKSIIEIAAASPENALERGLQALITESERAVRYGFTDGEIKRQKKEIFTSYENAYNERDKTNSSALVGEYMRNFISGECIPGIEYEYNFVKEYLDGITTGEINEMMHTLFTKDNRVLVILGPQKEGFTMPAEDQVLKMMDNALAMEITPYIDKISGSQLLEDKPTKGRILLARKNEKLGTVEMKLSNGARVILKPTDFKNDQILFGAYSAGGYSVYEQADHQSATYADDIVSQCGVGNYSLNDLTKLLAGKNVSLAPYIDAYYEGVNGSAAPRDIESMLQLNYLYFTHPRKDSAMFTSLMALQKDYYNNAQSNPEAYFSDQFTRAITQNNPMADIFPTDKDMAGVNMGRLYEIYSDRFSDASDFTFFMIGAFKVDSIKHFIEEYIASLPSTKRQEAWKDMGIRPPLKKTDIPVYKGNDPKSRVGLYFETPLAWDFKADYAFESLGQLLSIRYYDVIREELSGAYTLGLNGDMMKIPYSRAALTIMIPCSPDNTNALTKAAINVIKVIQKSGVKPEDLTKVKEAQRRDLEKNMKENSFWMSELMKGYRYDNPELINQYEGWIRDISSAEIQEAANKVNIKNYVRVILYPEKQQN